MNDRPHFAAYYESLPATVEEAEHQVKRLEVYEKPEDMAEELQSLKEGNIALYSLVLMRLPMVIRQRAVSAARKRSCTDIFGYPRDRDSAWSPTNPKGDPAFSNIKAGDLLEIESDGTGSGTKVSVNGAKLRMLQRVCFECKADGVSTVQLEGLNKLTVRARLTDVALEDTGDSVDPTVSEYAVERMRDGCADDADRIKAIMQSHLQIAFDRTCLARGLDKSKIVSAGAEAEGHTLGRYQTTKNLGDVAIMNVHTNNILELLERAADDYASNIPDDATFFSRPSLLCKQEAYFLEWWLWGVHWTKTNKNEEKEDA